MDFNILIANLSQVVSGRGAGNLHAADFRFVRAKCSSITLSRDHNSLCAKIKPPLPVKLFFAVMYIPDFDIEDMVGHFVPLAGPIDISLPPYEFTYTDYYTPEMGKGLKKAFYSFDRLIDPGALPEIKISVSEIENKHAVGGNRKVNIDPGYITAAKVVLSTSKDYAHRVYIGRGIYGDVHLQYRNGAFVPNPWTYPDYQSADVGGFLLRVRARFMEQIAEKKRQGHGMP